MNSRDHDRHMQRFEHLKHELMIAQQFRDFMPMFWSDESNTWELCWTDYEMLIMLKNVNEYRDRMDKKPVGADKIRAAESQASGHIDYTKKFALYCAEIILED